MTPSYESLEHWAAGLLVVGPDDRICLTLDQAMAFWSVFYSHGRGKGYHDGYAAGKADGEDNAYDEGFTDGIRWGEANTLRQLKAAEEARRD